MIYRLLIDNSYELYWAYFDVPPEERRIQAPQRFGGPGGHQGPGLADVMHDLELAAPHVTNPRARFYFTERGWEKYGRILASEARKRGHAVKVIRRKEPARSQVVYRDEFQVALLPASRK